MKKWSMLILATVIVCVCFTGCKNEASDSSDPGPLTSVEAVEQYLANEKQRGTDPNNPVQLVMKIDASEWRQLFNAIITSGKYVALDLSQCFNVPAEFSNVGPFYYCVSMVLPEGITSMGQGSCSNWQNLKQINLPASITEINNGAFYHCLNLTLVICPATTPPSLQGEEFFSFTPENLVIRVPRNSVFIYQMLWSDYADRIWWDIQPGN